MYKANILRLLQIIEKLLFILSITSELAGVLLLVSNLSFPRIRFYSLPSA